jgi:hypothetical protein
VIIGLGAAALSGFLCLASAGFLSAPSISVSILLLGRALLGAAENFIITGAVSWGLALVGAQASSKLIAWIGMAMFAALAAGDGALRLGRVRNDRACHRTRALITLALIAPLAPVLPRPDMGSGWRCGRRRVAAGTRPGLRGART